MITALLAVQSALAVAIARARKRASVIRALYLDGTDAAPLRLLSRTLAARARVNSRFERVLATHLATALRSFVRSNAFELLLLMVIGRVRSRFMKGGIR
jgi:hypothetical protein